ncbi:uncharacterized protein LOC110093716 [Dendrobium catenatum]|uniref:uncharacterized protein LOC110093716 n=1 Tax=Dendrobium catenatum TaxID=906689 RepID=UPI0009F6A0FD|nr:uncharacterized protein LOC110093716 [Dendrobium catenatum]
MTTIRMLLTLAVNRTWPILQLDVSNAFLHGDLPDDVYITQPRGFEDQTQPNAVCKLDKSLYGLKQAPRQWFQKITSFLQTRNCSKQINNLLHDLRSQFALKQLGQINLFLGIQISRTNTGFFLHQEHYASKLLQEAGFTDCKSCPTPITPATRHPQQSTELFHDPSMYRRLTGSLQYLTITRPNIAYATNQVCQHMQTPTTADFIQLKRILHYIKGTSSFGLPITPGDTSLQTYTDADWAADIADRKSISGICTFMGPNLLSWSVKKQVTVAKSSTEAEYRALSAATSEVIWLRRLAEELQLA